MTADEQARMDLGVSVPQMHVISAQLAVSGLLTGWSAAEMHLKQAELPSVMSSVGRCRFQWLQSECGCWQVTLPDVRITPRLLDRLQLMSVGQKKKLLSHRVNLWRGRIQCHDGEILSHL